MLGRKHFEDKAVTVSLAELVPEDDFLRQVEKAVDFSFIIPLVEPLYSSIGRPSIDSIVVVKILLIGFFYGITSERKLMREIQVNLSYRYFIGYNLDEKIPDHSSLTKVRLRFGEKTFQHIFDEIVRECIRTGLVCGEHLSFDATLVEADASLSSMTPRLSVVEFSKEVFENNLSDTETIESSKTGEEKKQYTPTLATKEETENRGKKRRTPLRNATHVSKTDPDATLGKDKSSMMAKLSYKDNIAVDSANRIIVDCVAIAGSGDEAGDLLQRIDNIEEKFEISPAEISADVKYGTEANIKGIEERGIEGFVGIRKSGENTTTGLYRLDKFKYDENEDVLICPAGQKLIPKPHLIQKRYRLFVADRSTCMNCLQKDKCTKIGERRKTGRTVNISINKEYVDRAKERVKSGKGRIANIIRKTRVETIFGEAKVQHCLRRAKWRGLVKVHIQFLLTAVAQNIKRMVKNLSRRRRTSCVARAFSSFFSQIFMSGVLNFVLTPVFARYLRPVGCYRKVAPANLQISPAFFNRPI